VALVGPTHPFRGGIVHHTACLADALRAGGATTVAGYRQVFPDQLYPRSTQLDPSVLGPREICPRTFDPLGPASWWRTARYLSLWPPALTVLQYWHPFFAAGLVGLTRALRRVAPHARVAAFCHNALPHDPFPLQRSLSRALFDSVDLVFAHGAAGEVAVQELAPRTPTVRVAHPVYRPLRVAEPGPAADARALLGVPAERATLLMLGHVRPYKNVEGLLEALARIPSALRPTLIIAGAWLIDPAPVQRRLKALGLEGTVVLREGYVPNDALPTLFAAADAVVLPYRSATQSGAVHLAFAYDRPVIVTNVGSLAEAVEDGVTGRVVPANDIDALAKAIVDTLDGDTAATMRAAMAARGGDGGWRALAARVREHA
jgi:glycosyltransferase involved in cell wall biosynthesis